MFTTDIARLFASRIVESGAPSTVVGLRRHRNVMVSTHRVTVSGWSWTGHGDGDAAAIILPLDAEVEGGGAVLFVHDGRRSDIRWRQGGLCRVVWLETRLLTDMGVDLGAAPLRLQETALVSAARAFITGVVAWAAPVTSAVTSYMLERLLLEVVFGMVLEAAGLPGSGPRVVGTKERARSLIMINRADAEYRTEHLAADLAVSARQLQRLFASDGRTVAGELRAARVELALSLLRDPQYAPLSVEQVATYSGFRNAGAMRAAFRAQGVGQPRRRRVLHG